MGQTKDQARTELKVLPYMLGKLIGGLLAVVGFPGAIFVLNRQPGAGLAEVWGYLLAGVIGVVVFVASSRGMARKVNETRGATTTRQEKAKTSLVSWLILLGLAGGFVLAVFLLTD